MKTEKRYLEDISGTAPLSLEKILNSRERRAMRQQEMMSAGGTLLCFTLNIAGAVKSSPLFSYAFQEGKKRVFEKLAYAGLGVLSVREYEEVTGNELYILTDGEILSVKSCVMEIEEEIPMGRLFDFDVMNRDNPKISRKDMGRPPRRCLLCGRNAAECARSGAHDSRALMEKTVELIWGYFAGEYADKVAQEACRAMLYEVMTTPKPGLVDSADSGSHKDMDKFTFIDSTCVLYPYFRECTIQGIQMQDRLSDLVEVLRPLGRKAEEKMNSATKGVNTHKGAIFSMGIFCGIAGTLSEAISNGCAGLEERISEVCKTVCSNLRKDLLEIRKKEKLSYGERIYRVYGITGIRGEAISGFPSVFNVGLPALERGIQAGKSLNDAGVVALVSLISKVQDTNIIARSDVQSLKRVQEKADRLLRDGLNIEDVEKMNEEFIRLNLSPGGSADLLALCYFCFFLKKDF